MSEPDHLAGEEPPAEPPPERGPRRYPSTIGGGLYLVVLTVAAVAGGVVVAGEWRLGIKVFSIALLAAATFRAVLPTRSAGMLEVRNRWLDVALLVVVGVAIFFLAVTIPDQPAP